MKYTDYLTPVNLVIGAVGVAALLIGVSCIQTSCGKKRDTNAAYSGAVADTHAKELADLKQQLSGKETEIASIKSQALTFKQKYEAAKAKIPGVPLPAPANQTDLASGLEKLGLGDGLEVQVGANTLMSVTDAQVVWALGEQAKRADALNEALITCAQAMTASEAIVKAQDEGLKLSSNALHVSQEEAAARQVQVNELAKSIKIEKAKGWQKYAWGIGGAVLVGLVKK